MFGGGCNDGAAIRAAIEVGAWSIHVLGRDCSQLKKSFEAAYDMVSQPGYGEVYRWAEDAFGEEDGLMKESVAKGFQMLEDDTDERQGDYRRRMRLPASLIPVDCKKCWEIGGFNLKKHVAPASPEKEAEVVLALLSEVRSKKAIDLDPTPSFDRKVSAGQNTNTRQMKLYLVLGGTNANHMAEAMRRKGDVADAVIMKDGKSLQIWWRLW
jgi:hypothetical protein